MQGQQDAQPGLSDKSDGRHRHAKQQGHHQRQQTRERQGQAGGVIDRRAERQGHEPYEGIDDGVLRQLGGEHRPRREREPEQPFHPPFHLAEILIAAAQADEDQTDAEPEKTRGQHCNQCSDVLVAGPQTTATQGISLLA